MVEDTMLVCLTNPAIVTGFLAILSAIAAGMWQIFHSRLAGRDEEIERLRRTMNDLSPENALSQIKAYRELGRQEADREFAPRIAEKEREIDLLSARLEEATHQKALGDGRSDLTARLEALEREKRELERQRNVSYGITDRLSQAALASVEVARKKAEAAALEAGLQLVAAGKAPVLAAQAHEAAEKAGGVVVSLETAGRRSERTRITVRGAELVSELLARGWVIPPRIDDYPVTEIALWSNAWHRAAQTAGNNTPQVRWSAESDYVTCRIDGEAGVVHAFAILGTLRSGWPSPMIKYFTGSEPEVTAAVHAWLTEYRVAR
jgi:hypothetical protein